MDLVFNRIQVMTIEIRDNGDCAFCELPNGTLLYGRNVIEVGEFLKRDCLRFVISEIKNMTVNANPQNQKEITDEICLSVLRRSEKTHGDSIEQFSSAGRVDLADKENLELSVIESFLPKMMSEDETKAALEKYILENGIEPLKKNIGVVMKGISSIAGVDKRVASRILSSILA